LALQIGEVRNLTQLTNALSHITSYSVAGGEEADVIARDDAQLAGQLEQMNASLGDLQVDDETRAEIEQLQELVAENARQALVYGAAASETAEKAKHAAALAFAKHGGIAQAVQDAPVSTPAQSAYYDQ
jgi:hypothetical protein